MPALDETTDDLPAAATSPFREEVLPRAKFADRGRIAGEPATDVRIELETGELMRERIVRHADATDGVVPSSAAVAAPTAFSLLISNAKLEADGKTLATNEDGSPIIAPAHEVRLTLEAVGRLGSEAALRDALRDAREVAAAQAARVFLGAELVAKVSRIPPQAAMPAGDS